MPVMENDSYSVPQINIPPTFPFVLKQYAKAAIKTQPYDLVRWSAAYFRALAHGETPPAKDRLEFPPLETPSGLTPGYLHVLIKQVLTLQYFSKQFFCITAIYFYTSS